MPEIEVIDENHLKFDSHTYHKDNRTNYYDSHFAIHRTVWEFFNGEIPKDCEVHHRDLNRSNNDISNLQMLTKAEHQKLHFEISSKIYQCKICGKEFKSKSVSKQNCYCSEECRNAGRYQKTLSDHQKIYICEYCGREFKATKYHHHKFCSAECRKKAQENRETKNCLYCGKEFTACKCFHQKFCSHSCSCKYHTENGTEVRICPVCGTSFKIRKSAKKVCCSYSCANKFRKQNNK